MPIDRRMDNYFRIERKERERKDTLLPTLSAHNRTSAEWTASEKGVTRERERERERVDGKESKVPTGSSHFYNIQYACWYRWLFINSNPQLLPIHTNSVHTAPRPVPCINGCSSPQGTTVGPPAEKGTLRNVGGGGGCRVE